MIRRNNNNNNCKIIIQPKEIDLQNEVCSMNDPFNSSLIYDPIMNPIISSKEMFLSKRADDKNITTTTYTPPNLFQILRKEKFKLFHAFTLNRNNSTNTSIISKRRSNNAIESKKCIPEIEWDPVITDWAVEIEWVPKIEQIPEIDWTPEIEWDPSSSPLIFTKDSSSTGIVQQKIEDIDEDDECPATQDDIVLLCNNDDDFTFTSVPGDNTTYQEDRNDISENNKQKNINEKINQRIVHFHSDKNDNIIEKVYFIDPITTKDVEIKDILWWSKAELQQTKQDANLIVQYITNCRPDYIEATIQLQSKFGVGLLPEEDNFNTTTVDSFQQKLIRNKRTDEEAVDIISNCEVRGLEKVLTVHNIQKSVFYDTDRSTVRNVINIQERLKKLNNVLSMDTATTYIAKQYRNDTQNAVVWARLLADGDTRAIITSSKKLTLCEI